MLRKLKTAKSQSEMTICQHPLAEDHEWSDNHLSLSITGRYQRGCESRVLQAGNLIGDYLLDEP